MYPGSRYTEKCCISGLYCNQANFFAFEVVNLIHLNQCACVGVLQVCYLQARGGGGGLLTKKLGRGVRPASQNPYPIYDQNHQIFDTLFMT